jgi:protein-S-isoprenylcysteine O-methyltransferase Ste14
MVLVDGSRGNRGMGASGVTDTLLKIAIAALIIACFPSNPLVAAGLVHPAYLLPASIAGGVVCIGGFVLAMAPKLVMRRRGGLRKGQTLAHTTRLVDTGVYAVVRHPQYLGWMLAVFVATPLLYPHWLFVILGVCGAVVLRLITREEEKRMVARFGDGYRDYMRRVPAMDPVRGLIRVRRRSRGRLQHSRV